MTLLKKPTKPVRQNLYIEFPKKYGETLGGILKRIPPHINYDNVGLVGDKDFSGNIMIFICYLDQETEEKYNLRLKKYEKELKKYNKWREK